MRQSTRIDQTNGFIHGPALFQVLSDLHYPLPVIFLSESLAILVLHPDGLLPSPSGYQRFLGDAPSK